MEDVGRVDILQPAEDLVHKVAHVVVAQLLSFEQFEQVRFHQTLHHVSGYHTIKEYQIGILANHQALSTLYGTYWASVGI